MPIFQSTENAELLIDFLKIYIKFGIIDFLLSFYFSVDV